MSDSVERTLGNVEGQLNLVVSRLDGLIARLDHRDEVTDKKIGDAHARISRVESNTNERFSKVDRKMYWQSGAIVAGLWCLTHLPTIISVAKAATH